MSEGFTPRLTLREAMSCLTAAGLLHEAVVPRWGEAAASEAAGGAGAGAERGALWTMDSEDVDDIIFTSVSYDTRKIDSATLLFCKGNFRPEYLAGADAKGLRAYVSETAYTDATDATALVVSDVKRAMALLAARFNGDPQDALTVVGITGTKGKTTTAYFTQAILNAASVGKCALLSSVDNCTDGKTYVESDLTTPESLDLYALMRQAVDSGMKYLVMEVSSQAYKVERVAGLTFDVGVFMNISPDHISAIEHPTFDDYFWCKRQIIRNSRRLLYWRDMDHAGIVAADAAALGVSAARFAVGSEAGDTSDDCVLTPVRPGAPEFTLPGADGSPERFRLSIPGDFNLVNAAAAVAIARAVGVEPHSSSFHALESVTVPGRMELFHDSHDPNVIAYVDYAHNYASTKAVLDFLWEEYGDRNPRITVVTGSTGDKAVDRREGIVRAAQDRAARLILTQEDTDREPMEKVLGEMESFITNPSLDHQTILSRAEAVEDAIAGARADAGKTGRLNIVVVIGKGREKWIKVLNKHVPYEGDTYLIERLFSQ